MISTAVTESSALEAASKSATQIPGEEPAKIIKAAHRAMAPQVQNDPAVGILAEAFDRHRREAAVPDRHVAAGRHQHGKMPAAFALISNDEKRELQEWLEGHGSEAGSHPEVPLALSFRRQDDRQAAMALTGLRRSNVPAFKAWLNGEHTQSDPVAPMMLPLLAKIEREEHDAQQHKSVGLGVVESKGARKLRKWLQRQGKKESDPK